MIFNGDGNGRLTRDSNVGNAFIRIYSRGGNQNK